MLSILSGFISLLKDGAFVRFKDRETAAITLASVIWEHVKNIEDRKKDILVLGIPRGGIIMANVVANKLNCTFDFIAPGRLVAPNDHELTIGATMNDPKTTYLISSVIEKLNIDEDYIIQEKHKRIKEINEKTKRYLATYYEKLIAGDFQLGSAQATREENGNHLLKYGGKYNIVILVDDGVFSGASVIVAARWIITNLKPTKLIVGATVIPNEIIPLIKKDTARNVDVVSLISPSIDRFKTVGVSYQNYMPVQDETLIEILRRRYA